MGAAPKILTKEDILRAMRVTRSNQQASRYLGVYWQTYAKYARSYIDKESGKTLYDLHKSSGKGIPKQWKKYKKDIPIERLISGISEFPKYPIEKLKYRLINEYILPESCGCCGFNERRIHDYKTPLMLSFIDGNRFNWAKDNLQLLCYNCYFLRVGDLFTRKEIGNDNDHIVEDIKRESKIWEIDDNMREHFEELGLINKDEKDPLDFTDYKV
jgi:hypothetical protein